MIHFLSEILIFLILTGILWFGIGWWVCSIERHKTFRKRESEWNHQLNTLRRDRDSFRDEVEKSHGRIRVLENRNADGSSPPKNELIARQEREKYLALTTELKDSLEEAQQKIFGYAQKVEVLQQQSVERDDIIEQLQKKLTETARTLHDRETRLEQLTTTATDQTLHAQNQHEQLQEIIIAHERTIAELREQHADNENKPLPDIDDFEAKQAHFIQGLSSDLDEAITQKDQIKQASEKEVEALHREIERLHKLQNTMQADSESETQRHRSTIDDLRTELQVAQAKTLAAEESNEQHLSRIRDLQNRLAEIDDKNYMSSTAEKAALDEATLSEMRVAISAQDRVIAELRAKLAESTSNASPTSVNPPTQPQVPHTQTHLSGDLFDSLPDDNINRSFNSSQPPDSFKLGRLDQRPGTTDNLKKISGIGPKYEKALNALGIYKFEQIASWTEQDIDWVEQQLRSFPDRISNGKWVEQAKALTYKNSS